MVPRFQIETFTYRMCLNEISSNFLKLKLPSANMCSLEEWSRFSFRYVNFNVHMDLLNIFSSLWELISFGALALPGRTCLFCLTPELDSVLAILAKSCLGAVLCQMWVWKILDLNIWKSENSRHEYLEI